MAPSDTVTFVRFAPAAVFMMPVKTTPFTAPFTLFPTTDATVALAVPTWVNVLSVAPFVNIVLVAFVFSLSVIEPPAINFVSMMVAAFDVTFMTPSLPIINPETVPPCTLNVPLANCPPET